MNPSRRAAVRGSHGDSVSTQTLSTAGWEVIARCRSRPRPANPKPEDLPVLRRNVRGRRELPAMILRHPPIKFGCFSHDNYKNTLLAVVSSVTAFSGWAQDNTTATSGDNLVVTANRFPQPVSSVLAPTSIVTRNDIDRWQAKSLTDVMRRLPGVDIDQNGGLGQKSSLFIRGTNSSHVLVLIDGIRLNQAGVSGSSDLSQIPISLVQKVEYIRGPRSAVYGSDAIGGVVNIITTREKNGTTLPQVPAPTAINPMTRRPSSSWATAPWRRWQGITLIPKGMMWWPMAAPACKASRTAMAL